MAIPGAGHDFAYQARVGKRVLLLSSRRTLCNALNWARLSCQSSCGAGGLWLFATTVLSARKGNFMRRLVLLQWIVPAEVLLFHELLDSERAGRIATTWREWTGPRQECLRRLSDSARVGGATTHCIGSQYRRDRGGTPRQLPYRLKPYSQHTFQAGCPRPHRHCCRRATSRAVVKASSRTWRWSIPTQSLWRV